MKVLIVLSVLCLFGSSHAVQYVWDLLKPALTSDEVLTIISSKDINYPQLNTIPDTSFQCSQMKQPGFYADVETKCQVFHRCDQAGNMTSYLCVNSTVFNQITLICDAWFNVECERSGEFVDFANSRLYTDKPLFDTPPADYIAPSQKGSGAPAPKPSSNKVKPPAPAKPAAKPAPKPAAKPAPTTTTAAPADSGADASADASGDGASAGGSAAASGSSDSSDAGDAAAAE